MAVGIVSRNATPPRPAIPPQDPDRGHQAKISANVHLLRCPYGSPLVSHESYKIIDTARPSTVLTPKAHALVLHTLPYKHSRLLPHVFTYSLLVLLL